MLMDETGQLLYNSCGFIPLLLETVHLTLPLLLGTTETLRHPGRATTCPPDAKLPHSKVNWHNISLLQCHAQPEGS